MRHTDIEIIQAAFPAYRTGDKLHKCHKKILDAYRYLCVDPTLTTDQVNAKLNIIYNSGSGPAAVARMRELLGIKKPGQRRDYAVLKIKPEKQEPNSYGDVIAALELLIDAIRGELGDQDD